MKRTVFALALGLLIGSAGTAVAANTDTVQATLAKFFVQVGTGKAQEVTAVVIDGTSYYPIRTIANMLGQNVDYSDETRTIILTPKTEAKNMNETVTKPEKISEVNKNEWVIYSEIKDRFGISCIPSPNGETTLKKGDLQFTLPKDVAKQDFISKVYTDGEISIRIKVVLGSIFYNIEDLKKAGFIDQ